MTDIKILPAVKQFLAKGHAHYINGKFHNTGEQPIEVINPATEEIVAKVPMASDKEINQAVASSYDAFNNIWKLATPESRQNSLLKFAEALANHKEELAQIETLCTGKLIDIARFEIDQSCSFLRYYAGWATKITGETVAQTSQPSMAGEQYTGFTRREPIGVVGGIIPWNFPVMISIWKLAAALTCGCTIVIKPSEFTPLSMLRVAQIAHEEAGIPAGVINVVNGLGNVGQALIDHPHIAKISFTGSMSTGAKIGQGAIKNNIKRFTLELGGKNAAGFLADIDIDEAVQGIIAAGLSHQGQICASAERIYIHESIIDKVTEKLVTTLADWKIGSPLNPQNQFGPLSNRPHFEKILSFFEKAKQEGDQIVFGGKKVEGKGYYVYPTVIRAKNEKSALLHEETFGPVLTLLPFKTDEELVKLMNDSPYGLTASIWTNNLSKAMRLVAQVEAGTVWVNMHLALDPSISFGGAKGSGVGREFGSHFIDDYTELKSVIVRY